ncbi:hypothetical protein RZS08_62610, partial [Arthrospira platensis SPKY1]|nr:hypothetical protein [Arthrospira platensis SPKY1]
RVVQILGLQRRILPGERFPVRKSGDGMRLMVAANEIAGLVEGQHGRLPSAHVDDQGQGNDEQDGADEPLSRQGQDPHGKEQGDESATDRTPGGPAPVATQDQGQ